ncbi:MAG: hypothetical protein HC801_12910 [Nitrospira sp.]|nr:hypothetical protein [Nitrospira sp.]
MDRIIAMVELATQISSSASTPQPASSKSGNRQRRHENTNRNPELAQLSPFRDFIQGVLKDIRQDQAQTFVVDLNEYPSGKAVVVLFLDYLRDKTLSEVNNKEYYLLGKVVRIIENDDGRWRRLSCGISLHRRHGHQSKP